MLERTSALHKTRCRKISRRLFQTFYHINDREIFNQKKAGIIVKGIFINMKTLITTKKLRDNNDWY